MDRDPLNRSQRTAAWALILSGLALALWLGGPEPDPREVRLYGWGRWLVGVHVAAAVAFALLAVGTLFRRGLGPRAVAGLAALVVVFATGHLYAPDGPRWAAMGELAARNGFAPAAWRWAAVLHLLAAPLVLAWLAPRVRRASIGAALVLAATGLVLPIGVGPPVTALPGGSAVRSGLGAPPSGLRSATAPVSAPAPGTDAHWTIGPGGCRACHARSAPPPSAPVHAAHPPAVAACTDCHRGTAASGRRVIAHGAHPRIAAEPILAGGFAEAACIGCHTPHGPPAGASVWRAGRELWDAGGCAGCHESGGRLGPDLARVAAWWAAAPMSTTGEALSAAGFPPLAAFLGEAIVAPRSHVPGTPSAAAEPAHMPAYDHTVTEVAALGVYVMGLREWGFGASRRGPSPAPGESTLATGAELYHDPEVGCALCHRLRGDGGELGPSLDSWRGRDPATLAALLADPERQRLAGYPPIMPMDYGERLSRTERLRLARYVVGFGTEAP